MKTIKLTIATVKTLGAMFYWVPMFFWCIAFNLISKRY